MASNIPKEYQKSYTWDAIVFTDGATCVRIEPNRTERTNERTTDATDPTERSRWAEGFARDAERGGAWRRASGLDTARGGERMDENDD